MSCASSSTSMPRSAASCFALTKLTDSATCGSSTPLSAATVRISCSRSSIAYVSIVARSTGASTICAAKRPSFSARLARPLFCAAARPPRRCDDLRGEEAELLGEADEAFVVGVDHALERQVHRRDEDRAAQRLDDVLRRLHRSEEHTS